METRPMQHTDSAVRLGQLIEKTRQKKNLSIRQISDITGIPRATLGRIARGEIARPRPDTLTTLADALDIPIADLWLAVEYVSPDTLPSFAPYLRARYRDLSARSVQELQVYLDTLAQRDGVRLDGPLDREDELR